MNFPGVRPSKLFHRLQLLLLSSLAPCLVLAQELGTNSPPTISIIPSQTTPENQDTARIPFAVSDLETAATDLILSAISSNPQLVPNENIYISKGGTNRWLFVTPALCQYGVVNITVTVQDADGATASNTFRLTITYVQRFPLLTSFSNQVASVSSIVGPLHFVAGASCSDPDPDLGYNGFSSNTNLVLNSGIVFGGSDTNRAVTITPVPNQTGQTLITISVTDKNGANGATQFKLTIVPTNQPPRISLIPNQTLGDGESRLVNFQVSDEETAAADLEVTVTVSSSDSSLLPEASIQLGGSGTNRTLYFESARCKYGASLVTVTVRDTDGAVAITSFVVIVSDCQQPPTISRIRDQVISASMVLGPFDVRVSGPCGCNESLLRLSGITLNQELIPNGNIQFAGSGNVQRALIIPAANQIGSADIVFTVSDTQLTSSTTFKVTVVPAPSINSTNGQFHFSQSLPPGNVVIEASTNLVNWLPVATNSVAGGVLNFTDASASNFVARFYRLVSPTTTP